MPNMREQLETDLAEVTWRDLRIHLQRDAIIIVDKALDLVNAAIAVTGDDKPQIEQWLDAGTLGKPTAEQLEAWESELDKGFRMLIVQPFILVQEIMHA